ncbi:Hsp20/alpha crystallin family protein [Methanogenium organophilum]|uniref:Hsp20/alpha crystallin family protein n=1 Tax=Methanogenium organophilum TaxID=2199 RepID=A0A9X9T7T2_METOG|nr:Hsp20/alpha crystallin family protein [Methanogenium organophilum]WAI00731.1 Hsp20/alpha crystallin family protein [Methanogenium organophilum]
MIRRRRYPFALLWNEIDELMAEWESRVQNTVATGASLPSMVGPALKREFRVDVREEMDEVIVTADLPGVDKNNVVIRLVTPLNIEISVAKKTEPTEEGADVYDYYTRERLSGNLHRIVSLPAEVIDENASASFRNGVLEIRLRKAIPESGSVIPID